MVSNISKQESDLHSQIEQHGKLVTQVSSANQIHLDKQTELQKKLSIADDAVSFLFTSLFVVVVYGFGLGS